MRQDIIQGHTVTVQSRYDLVCTEDGANKFWTAIQCKDHEPETSQVGKVECIVLKWGRIGTAGHTEVKRFQYEYQARKYMTDRYRDKMRKGYTETTDTVIVPITVSVPHVETEWDLL